MNYFVIIVFVLLSCENRDTLKEQWKAEIVATEKAFSDLALSEGVAKAFDTFAADDAVIMRSDSIISHKQGIAHFYSNSQGSGKLTWKPTFVDVSDSGDLGYTYGTYTYAYTTKEGESKESQGIFHTVWKRQTNGDWRFVYD